MAGKKDNHIIEIVAVAALVLFLLRLFRKTPKILVKEPVTTGPECENIVYQPLSQYGPIPADLIGKNWCYKGDGSFFDGEDVTFGSPYAEEQAQQWSEQKQTEAIQNTNRKVIQFRLINTGSEPIITKTLDTTQDQTIFNPAPSAPVASSATDVTASGFTANWSASTNATGYYLDVATDSAFTSYVSGYENLDVGNVTEYDLSGLAETTTYYYRIRAYNNSTSVNSNTIIAETKTMYDDWYLPSLDELNEIYTQLYLFGVGDFDDSWPYPSSSELNATDYWIFDLTIGLSSTTVKTANYVSRAIRSFTSTTPYSLRSIGPAGGWVFYANGNDYLECAPYDNTIQVFSNINNLLIGTTGTAIGTGQANTTAIINQAGHINSAAKLCNDLKIEI